MGSERAALVHESLKPRPKDCVHSWNTLTNPTYVAGGVPGAIPGIFVRILKIDVRAVI